MPFVGADINDYEDERDFLWRLPIRKIQMRPIYGKKEQRRKLRITKENGKQQ